jgi:hypothetical protein
MGSLILGAAMIVVSVLFYFYRSIAAAIVATALEARFPKENVTKFVSVFVVVFAVTFFLMALVTFLGGVRDVFA